MDKRIRSKIFLRMASMILIFIISANSNFILATTPNLEEGAALQNIAMYPEQRLTLRSQMFPSLKDVGAVIYSSSRPNIVEVDENGVLSALAPGTATITVYSAGNNNIKSSCTVTVYSLKPVTGLTLIEKTAHSISFEWNALEWASGYDVLVNGEVRLSTAHAYASIDNLTPDAAYNIRIRGKKGDETGPAGSLLHVKTDMGLSAAATKAAGSSIGHMSGLSSASTNASVILITNAAQLQNINQDLSGHYKLANNIDLWQMRPFTPIGSESSPFTGTFDGNGFKVSNLAIESLYSDFLGLFGYTEGATIVNLAVEVSYIWGNSHVGGLIGYSEGGVVAGCSVSGYINANYHAGGLIGYSNGTIVHRSSAQIEVNSYSAAGGLIGVASGGAVISDCYATGFVEVYDSGGGLIAHIGNGVKVTNCYAVCNIAARYDHYCSSLIYSSSGSVTGCYYNIDTFPGHDDYAQGKTRQELMRQITFSGWRFGNIWGINEGSSYPYLVPSDLVAAVTGLVCTGTTSHTLSISWGALTVATGYDIFVNGAFKQTTSGTSTTISGLAPDTVYSIQVRGKTGIFLGPLSNPLQVKTAPPPVASVSVSPSAQSMDIGDIIKLTASISPSNATDQALTWSSNNTGVATVDSGGNVTAITPGQAVITARSANGVSGTSTITVNALRPVTGLVETANTANTVSLRWDALPGVTGYDVFVNGSIRLSSTTLTSATISSLTHNTYYDIQVRGRVNNVMGPLSGILHVQTDKSEARKKYDQLLAGDYRNSDLVDSFRRSFGNYSHDNFWRNATHIFDTGWNEIDSTVASTIYWGDLFSGDAYWSGLNSGQAIQANSAQYSSDEESGLDSLYLGMLTPGQPRQFHRLLQNDYKPSKSSEFV